MSGLRACIIDLDACLVEANRRLDSTAPARDAFLLILTALLASIAALLFATLGYHALFMPVHDLALNLPDLLVQSVTFSGDALFALVVVLCLARYRPELLWTGIVASLIASAASHGLKALFHATRPAGFLLTQHGHVIGPILRNGSFPSGHSVTAFVMAALVVRFVDSLPLKIAALAAAFVIAASRTWVGVHWPVDTLAGAAIGVMAVLCADRIARQWRWGLTRTGHLILVALLAACAADLLWAGADYPLASPWARSIAALAFVLVLYSYVLRPWRRQPAGGGGTA